MSKYRPKRLTDAFLRTLTETGRHSDGPGSNGLTAYARRNSYGQMVITFQQKIRINGRVTTLTLGRYGNMSLKEARRVAEANARAVQEDRDPRTPAILKRFFEEVGLEYIQFCYDAGKWVEGSRSRRTWINSLRTHVFPHIGHLRPDQITTVHLMQFLRPLWITTNRTARDVVGRISAIMRYARAWELCDTDPTEIALPALPPVHLPVEHRKALHHIYVGDALQIVDAYVKNLPPEKRTTTHEIAAKALWFAAYTCVRPGEVCAATWDQINIEEGVWYIPASKNGEPHHVPLSDQALRILEETARLTGTRTGPVFPAARGGHMYTDTLRTLLQTSGIDAHGHGFRSSYRTWAKEQGINEETAEAVLAHKERNPYIRTNLFEQRIDIMGAWANYITHPPQTARKPPYPLY